MEYLLKKKLLSLSDKPSFDLLIKNELKIRCLFDTGADTPVFTLGDDALCKYFPAAQLQNNLTYILSGFGKGTLPTHEMSLANHLFQILLFCHFRNKLLHFRNFRHHAQRAFPCRNNRSRRVRKCKHFL